MAKKSNLVTIVLSVVLVLGLVYFFRPQTFNFLKQGFSNSGDPENPDDFNPTPGEEEGFFDCREGETLVNGECVEGFFDCVDGKDTETGEDC